MKLTSKAASAEALSQPPEMPRRECWCFDPNMQSLSVRNAGGPVRRITYGAVAFPLSVERYGATFNSGARSRAYRRPHGFRQYDYRGSSERCMSTTWAPADQRPPHTHLIFHPF